MVLVEILAVILTAFFGVYLFYKRSFQYWKKKGVPYRTPSFPFGNMENPFTSLKNVGTRLQRHYDHFKERGVRFGGIYGFCRPVFLPLDPKLYRSILATDFNHFVDRGMYHNERDDPLSGMLFLVDGNVWKRIRSKMTPTFTSGKMKMMFNVLYECSQQMVEALDEKIARKEATDLKNMLACFTTDVICSCAFGLECNSCKNPNENFRYYGQRFLDFGKWRSIQNFVTMLLPQLCRTLRMRMVPKDVEKFILPTVRNTIDYRNKNKIERKDFMQIMVDIYNKGELTFEEVAAQVFTFLLAGFETSSSTAMFAMYELSVAPDIQEKAREEVLEIVNKYDGVITYDSLKEMTYLCQIVDETLRKYPVVPVTSRDCVKDYTIPGTDIVIEKKTKVYLSLIALHTDPDYFPDPQRFDPDRFSEENKALIKPYTYLPFGDGPRNCIGLRFGLMQARLAVATMLRHYRFTLNEKTKYPIEFSNTGITMGIVGGLYLNLERIGEGSTVLSGNGVRLDSGKIPNGHVPNGKVVNGHVSNETNGNGCISSGEENSLDVKACNGHIPNGKIPKENTPNGKRPNGYVANRKFSNGCIPIGKIPNGVISNGAIPIEHVY